MSQYLGFSTINSNKARSTNLNSGVGGGPGTITEPIIVGKKFKLTDQNLVIQDFINALNIRQGEKVGQPQYGTTLWNFVFEPSTQDVTFALEQEVRRVASQDPRLVINFVRTYPQENGILLEVQMAVAPYNQAALLSVFFNSNTNTASIQS
jgi:phage baseplate assembly protein W